LTTTQKPIAIKEASHKSLSGYHLYASQLKPSGMNLRDWGTPANRAKMLEFADSILAGGVKKALEVLVLDDGIVIDDGETRWLAVRYLEGFDVLYNCAVEPRVAPDTILIPVMTKDKRTTASDRLFDIMLANSGRDFTDLEYAVGIKQQIDWGVRQTEIARKLGRPATWVSRIFQLTFVPTALLPFLRNEQIKTTTILNMMDRFGPDETERLVLAEIESGKGQAAVEYQEAIAEATEKQAEVERMIKTGEGTEAIHRKGAKTTTTLEQAQQEVAAATERADAARKATEEGPARVTEAALLARAEQADPTSTVPVKARKATPNRVSKASFEAFRDVVEFFAKRSMQPELREAANEALKRAGFDPVAAQVDDQGNELPVEGEVVAAAS
jgi:hypothetical protein